MTTPTIHSTPKTFHRPWWLTVNKSAQLITTVREETKPGERIFVICGEPLIQGLGWLTWGPLGALSAIGLLAGLAIALDVSQQGWLVKTGFIIAFLVLPALAWAGVSLVVTRLSEKYLQAERQAESRQCLIRLHQEWGELSYQIDLQSEEEKLAYQLIRQARVAHPIGGRDPKLLQLVLETDSGPVILLNESLATMNQKMDLAQEIQQALKEYIENKNLSSTEQKRDEL